MKPRSSFRIEPEIKQRMKEAVKKGLAKSMTDLIQKAVNQFLENPS